MSDDTTAGDDVPSSSFSPLGEDSLAELQFLVKQLVDDGTTPKDGCGGEKKCRVVCAGSGSCPSSSSLSVTTAAAAASSSDDDDPSDDVVVVDESSPPSQQSSLSSLVKELLSLSLLSSPSSCRHRVILDSHSSVKARKRGYMCDTKQPSA